MDSSVNEIGFLSLAIVCLWAVCTFYDLQWMAGAGAPAVPANLETRSDSILVA